MSIAIMESLYRKKKHLNITSTSWKDRVPHLYHAQLSGDDFKQAWSWCNDLCQDDWIWHSDDWHRGYYNAHFYFLHNEDALAFKLSFNIT